MLIFSYFLKGAVLLSLLIFLSVPEMAWGQNDMDTRPQVWRLNIEGNEQYSNMVLRNIIATEAPSFFRRLRFWNREGFDYVEDEVRRDAIRIERYYQRRGFPHVSVDHQTEIRDKPWQRAVTFHVDEGPPTMIENLTYTIEGNEELEEYLETYSSFRRSRAQQPLREEQRYQLIRHSDVEGQFRNVLRNIGFAYAQVSVSAETDTLANTADVMIHLDPGPIAYFNNINITGTQSVPEDYVLRESDITPGDRFSQDKLRVAQRQIFSHHLFRFATISVPSQPRDTIIDINIDVREHALRSIRILGGIGIEEIVRADVSWQHRNPFGNAHSFTSRGRLSFLEQSVNIDYLIPYIFNTYSSITISPFAQRLDEQNYLLLRGGISNSFLYQYSRELAGTIAYEYSRNEERIHDFDAELDLEERFGEQLYDISAIQLSGYYNMATADQPRGWALRPFAEFSGIFGSGDLQYQRFRLDVRRYINFTNRLQLALRTDVGIMFTNDEELPSHVRFYAGGTNSVRGWTRRQLGPKRAAFEDGEFLYYLPEGGRSALTFNIELRQDLRRLLRNFGIAAFFDGGQVWRESNGFNVNELQYGVGGGLRYQSPIGPVRVDMGYKINPNPHDLSEFEGTDFGPPMNRWALHFSIGQAF